MKATKKAAEYIGPPVHPIIDLKIQIRAGKRWQRLYKHFIARDKIKLTVAGTSWEGYLVQLDSAMPVYPGHVHISFMASGGPV